MKLTRSYFPARSLPQAGHGQMGLKDALVEFFMHSKVSSKVLRLLSARCRPASYRRLMDEIRFGFERDELPPSAVRAVLRITQAAGLVRQTRDGFAITALGREVQECIESRGESHGPVDQWRDALAPVRRAVRTARLTAT